MTNNRADANVPEFGEIAVGQRWRLLDGRVVKVAEKFEISRQIRVKEVGTAAGSDWLPLYHFAGATLLVRAVPDRTVVRVGR